MAAAVELTVRDLVRKYGWEILPYVSGLAAVNALSNDQVLFVDANHTNATDADDGVHGHLPDKPLATVDYAIGLCNANAVILVAPGHVEDYDGTTTGFDADVAGVSIIGIGQGSTRPRFDFNNASSLCAVGANDVRLKNLTFRPSVAAVSIGLDIETGVTGTTLEDVEFLVGEAGDGTDEFIKAIHLTSGNHDTVLKNVKILTHASCDGATHGVHVDAASDRLTFDNVIIDGPWSTGGIVEDAAGLNHVVVDCSIDTTGTNYGFNSSSTFAKKTKNVSGDTSSIRETLSAVLGRPVTGNIFFVDPVNGSASNDGSDPNSAFATTQAGIDACTANNGDVIVRMKGGEEVTASVNFNKAGITVIANLYGLSPALNGEYYSIYADASYTTGPVATVTQPCTIIGMAFASRDAGATFYSGAAMLLGGSGDATPLGVHIKQCRFPKWNLDNRIGIAIEGSTDCLIEECYFEGVGSNLEVGIYFQGATQNLEIINNRFRQCTAALQCGAFAGGGPHLIAGNNIVEDGKLFDTQGNTGNGIIFNNWLETAAGTASYDAAVGTLQGNGWQFSGNNYSE